MSTNKHALVRYLAIDRRLRSKQLPPPTLDDLIEVCTEALDGLKISRRTIQEDIRTMRYDQGLKFCAPIRQVHKHIFTYTYTDADYSIIQKLAEL